VRSRDRRSAQRISLNEWESIDNIILTDYRRFILIRGNQAIFGQSLSSLADLKKPKSQIPESKIDEFLQLTDTFFDYREPKTRSADILQEELSKSIADSTKSILWAKYLVILTYLKLQCQELMFFKLSALSSN